VVPGRVFARPASGMEWSVWTVFGSLTLEGVARVELKAKPGGCGGTEPRGFALLILGYAQGGIGGCRPRILSIPDAGFTLVSPGAGA
jgi:hypothetical protein